MTILADMQDSSVGLANELEQVAIADWLSLEASMNYDLGVDVSRHQGEMNWQKCAAQGVKFAAIRATVGNYYTDPRVVENWNGAKEVGLDVTLYHVVVPDNSVSSQMGNFFALVEMAFLKSPDLPYVLDCELTRNQSQAVITTRIDGCAQALINLGYARPIIYTRQDWWDNNVLSSNYWRQFPLWVANYTNAPQPTLPRDWKDWFIWQYTSKGDGEKYGAESKSIDLNRMSVVVDPPDPEPVPDMVRTTAYRLNVRTAPVVKPATRIGSVPRGTVFEVIGGYADDDDWYEVVCYVHKNYVEAM